MVPIDEPLPGWVWICPEPTSGAAVSVLIVSYFDSRHDRVWRLLLSQFRRSGTSESLFACFSLILSEKAAYERDAKLSNFTLSTNWKSPVLVHLNVRSLRFYINQITSLNLDWMSLSIESLSNLLRIPLSIPTVFHVLWPRDIAPVATPMQCACRKHQKPKRPWQKATK